MGDLVFLYPERVHLIWLVLLVSGLLLRFELKGRDALSRFVSVAMQARLAERVSTQRRVLHVAAISILLVSGVLALMRPQTRSETQTVESGRFAADIMVVLDVSKSMLAEDAAPNRLSRARAEIGELVSNLSGHRIGLVAFAGRASVLCPLTSDYGFFRMILKGVDPKSVSRGGTRIGEAIRKAMGAFPAGEGSKLMLLITDGEDHDSYPEEAAKAALEAGIRIVTIGFGSEEGSQILITDPETGAKAPLADRNGQVVVSRLDGSLLRKIALTTEGVYVPAGVAALDLESIVRDHIQPIMRSSKESSVRIVPGEQYPWFVLAALVALLSALWIGSTGARRQTAS